MSGKYAVYPEYKDSGVEWLGNIPTEWELWKLTHAYDEIGSGTTPPSGSDELYGGDVPWITTGELREKEIFSTTKNVTLDALRKLSALRKFPSGSIAIAMYGATIGRLGILGVEATTNQACCVLTKSNIIDNKYLYYWLQAFKQDIVNLASGGGQPNINQEVVASLKISLPKKFDQQKIANFLDHETAKIDTLIEKQQQLIALLKEKRQAVISHAVTKGLNPDAPMRDSGVEWLGEVPEHWRVTKLGQLAFMQEGPGLRTWQFKSKGTRVICVTNITEDGIDFSKLEKFISDKEYIQSYRHFTVNSGDILLSSSGNSWGKVAKYEGEEKVILNTSTIRLNELRHKPLIVDYLQNFLHSDACREQLGVAMTGSCQPNFGPTHLKEIRTPIPPESEQNEISEYIDQQKRKFDQPLSACEEAIRLMQERRTALISAAVTGKIDVRDFNPKDAEAC
tara:strand:- start:1776 stop:3131 length:1356 start_codon:yes stop_codon:yes gene_type:complete